MASITNMDGSRVLNLNRRDIHDLGLLFLISPCPNSTTRPSLRITLKSERSYDQPVTRRCVYSSCSYGPLLPTASGRPRIPTTCCRVIPGSRPDIFSPVVQADKTETTETVSKIVLMHARLSEALASWQGDLLNDLQSLVAILIACVELIVNLALDEASCVAEVSFYRRNLA